MDIRNKPHSPLFFALIVFAGLVLGVVTPIIALMPIKISAVVGLAVFFLFLLTIMPDRKKFLVLLFVTTIPIGIQKNLFFEPHDGGAMGIQITAADIVLALLYLHWLIELRAKRCAKIDYAPEQRNPLIFYFTIGLLSALYAPSPSLVLFETVMTIKCYLIFLYVLNHFKEPSDMKFLVKCMFIPLAIHSVIAVLQKYTTLRFGFSFLGAAEETMRETLKAQEFIRISGLFSHPIALGTYYVFAIPFLARWTFEQQGFMKKLFYFGCLGLALFSLVASLSRGAWIGFSIAMAFLVVLSAYKGILTLKQVVIGTSYVIVAAAAIALLYGRIIWLRIFESEAGNVSSRFDLLQIAFSMIKEYPFLGVGLNNFSEVAEKFDTKNIYGEMPSIFPVHNFYVLTYAELGIAGLIPMLLILYRILKQPFMLDRHAIKNRAYASYVIALSGSFLGFSFMMLSDYTYRSHPTAYLFWLSYGLTLIFARLYQVEPTPLQGHT